MHITIWNEFCGQDEQAVCAAYPNTLHGAIAEAVAGNDATVSAVTLDMPHQGLSDELLNKTDVLMWWGHRAHEKVDDALVAKIQNRVLCGMGIVFLHSAHMSKPFRALMGTSCTLQWREAGERERLWTVSLAHPIAQGVPPCVVLEHEEMYGEPFGIPEPDNTVFTCWYQGGRVFRGGITYNRGAGKVFYFQPGHETFPTYKNPLIQKTLVNAVRWAYSNGATQKIDCECVKPLEKLN